MSESYRNRVDVVTTEEEQDASFTVSKLTDLSLGDPLASSRTSQESRASRTNPHSKKSREYSNPKDDLDDTKPATKEATRRKKTLEKTKLMNMMESHGETASDEERRRRFDAAFTDDENISMRWGGPRTEQAPNSSDVKTEEVGIDKSTVEAPGARNLHSRENLVNSRLSQRSQRLLATYYENTDLSNSSRDVSEASSGDEDPEKASTTRKRRQTLIDDTKEAVLRMHNDELSSNAGSEFCDEYDAKSSSKEGLALRAVAIVRDLSAKATMTARQKNTREDICQSASQAQQRRPEGRTRRRWQRFDTPGAVQMEGRAFGAPPRPPDAKPTLVEGLSQKPTDMTSPEYQHAGLESQSLMGEGVTLTADGPLVHAAPVSEEECAPRAMIDVAYAESSPLAFKDLFVERSIRWRLIGICISVFLLTMIISVAATHMTSGNEEDDSTDEGSTSKVDAGPGASPTFAPTFVNEDLLNDLAPISGLHALSMPGSPQRRAVGWLSSIDNSGLEVSDAGFVQRYVMAVLFFAMGGEHWVAKEKWLNPDLHECDWSSSIHCEADHYKRSCVTGIDLSRSGLRGHIPREIEYLVLVESINLSKNSLSGSLPPELFNIPTLTELVLDSNKITSEIPPSIAKATFLDFLDFSSNNFEGKIPEEMYDLTNLRTLDLASNRLTGTISSRLENLQVLGTINMMSNSLVGTIPQALGKLSNLAFVRLDNNQLSGSLPVFSSTLLGLQELTVSHNNLSGTIPSLPEGGIAAFGALTDTDFRLQQLNISHNAFQGVLPEFIGLIPSLREFDFSGNAFRGTFPSMPGMWRSLELISGGENQLSGIPPSDFPPTLTQYDFNRNFFVGGLPAELFTTFPRLEYLSLSHNPLGGTIPTSLDSIPHLVGLDLQNCELIGVIPDLTHLSSLGTIDIGENYISGTLPVELGILSTLTHLKMGSNRLTGTVPVEIGHLSNLDALILENNQLTGSLPSSLGNLSGLVQFRVVNNPMEGAVPEELCAVIEGLSVDHVGCNLQCSCCSGMNTCDAVDAGR